MSSKKKYVLFKEGGGARIFINPDNVKELEKLGKLVLAPELDAVAGIPPENWAVNAEGKVVESDMSQSAKILIFKRRKKALMLKIAAAVIVVCIGVYLALPHIPKGVF